jgi:hypothetical protein
MVLVLLLGGAMGWLAYLARVQRVAVAAIKAAGGEVYYDLEWEFSDFRPMPRKPRWPKWLVDRLGPDYLGQVIAVRFPQGPSNQADDQVMSWVGRLSAIEDLDLGAFDIGTPLLEGKSRVTDEGIKEAWGENRGEE